MRLTSRVSDSASGQTEVSASSDVSVTGVLAQFGRGMIQDVSDQLFQKFTQAMRAQLEPPAAASPPRTSEPGGGSPATPASSAATPGAGSTSAVAAPSPSSTAAAAPAPVDIGTMGAAAAGRAVGRAVRRPGFWMITGIIALVIWWLFFS
jgi:hypothetical protein